MFQRKEYKYKLTKNTTQQHGSHGYITRGQHWTKLPPYASFTWGVGLELWRIHPF